MSDPIALGQPTFGDEEVEAVREVLESGWVAGQGPRCAMFEEAFAARVGARHAVAVSNCTTALHLALLAHNVGSGQEVVVADYTYPATGHSVLFCGATPVFADVLSGTATVSPASVADRLTPRTVGIIAVDALGQCADYAELQAIADEHGLFLIEDAACSAGATYQGRAAGTLADIACFSLHGRKGITSGEGGIVTTDDDRVAHLVRKRSSFGVESALARAGSAVLPIPVFETLGYNYKLSDIQAAIALVQLGRLDDLLKARRAVADAYDELLSGIDGVDLPRPAADRDHTWQTYALTLDASIDRGAAAMAMRAEGIGANIGTYASHVQPVYGPDVLPCPVSADLFARHLAIPMHANLTESQVERVAAAVRRAVASAWR